MDGGDRDASEAEPRVPTLALTKGRCHPHALGRGVSRMGFFKLEVQRGVRETFQL